MTKYEWIEAIMASNVNTGTKVFAFGLYKHMNKEGTCFPGDEGLAKAIGMKRGHFYKYRTTLADAGWIVMEVRKTKNGNSYFYRLPENAPDGGVLNTIDTHQSATDGGVLTIHTNNSMPPMEQRPPQIEVQTATESGMNTVNNTTMNTLETTAPAAPVEVKESKVREEENEKPSTSPNLETKKPLTLVDSSNVQEYEAFSNPWKANLLRTFSSFKSENMDLVANNNDWSRVFYLAKSEDFMPDESSPNVRISKAVKNVNNQKRMMKK